MNNVDLEGNSKLEKSLPFYIYYIATRNLQEKNEKKNLGTGKSRGAMLLNLSRWTYFLNPKMHAPYFVHCKQRNNHFSFIRVFLIFPPSLFYSFFAFFLPRLWFYSSRAILVRFFAVSTVCTVCTRWSRKLFREF